MNDGLAGTGMSHIHRSVSVAEATGTQAYLEAITTLTAFFHRSAHERARVGELSRHRAGRRHGRGDQVDRSGRSHPPVEVAVRRRRGRFSLAGDARSVADARPASRGRDHRAEVAEQVQQPFVAGVALHLGARRGHRQAHTRREGLAAQHLGRRPQVSERAAGARGDDHVVHGDVARLGQGQAVARVAGRGHRDRHIGQVQVDDPDVVAARIGVNELVGAVDAALLLQEVDDRLAGGDDAGHESALDRHVGEDGELVDRPLVETVATELDDAGVGGTGAPLLLAEVGVADQVQDEVFWSDHALGVAGDVDAHRLGDGDRHDAGAKREGHGRGPDTEGEAVEDASGRRVRVGQHHDGAGLRVVFDHHAVTHTGLEATRGVHAQVEVRGRSEHLVGHGGRRSQPSRLDVGRHGGVIQQAEVVREAGHGVRPNDRFVAESVVVQRHHHSGGVFVHTAETGTAEHLVAGQDVVDPVDLAARPGVARDDLFGDGHGGLRGEAGVVPRFRLTREPGVGVSQQSAGVGHGEEEGRQVAVDLVERDRFTGLQTLQDGAIGRERQAVVDHVLLEDALEAAGDHQLDAGAAVRDHGNLAAGTATVGVAADDDLEPTVLDGVGLHHALEVLQEVGSEDVAGVAEGAVSAADHGVSVDTEDVVGLGGNIDHLASELATEQVRISDEVKNATSETERTRMHGRLLVEAALVSVESGPVSAAIYLLTTGCCIYWC